MSIVSRSNLRSFTIILVGLLVASFTFTTEDVFAHRRGGSRHSSGRHSSIGHRSVKHSSIGRVVRHRAPIRHNRVIVTRPRHRPGKIVANLPHRHSRVIVRGRPYYYGSGSYYYRRPRGYVVVAPPIGTLVPHLAIGFNTVWVGGLFYYYYGNIFYRRVPSGYVVVEPPTTSTVVLTEPSVVEPAQSASGRVSVIAARLNVRTGPSLSNPILYQVRENTTLRVHGRDRDWLYVELPSGKYGWVMEEFTVQMDVSPSG